MKTLLVPTDFSANATHSAKYAFNLAKKLKAKLCLCNALLVPAEMPTAGVVVWPMEEYSAINEESINQLKLLKERLEKKDNNYPDFQPPIKYTNKIGILADVVKSVLAEEDVQLVVMGTHNENGISHFLLRNNSHEMVDYTDHPLLLVPPSAEIAPLTRIAFATDFRHAATDLQSIYQLIAFARPLNADVLITHVYDKTNHNPEFQNWAKRFLTDISNKADYPKIYYRPLESDNTETGLNWLCRNGQIDALAMVHYKHDFVEKLLKGSHTQNMANHIQIPLLVLPAQV